MEARYRTSERVEPGRRFPAPVIDSPGFDPAENGSPYLGKWLVGFHIPVIGSHLSGDFAGEPIYFLCCRAFTPVASRADPHGGVTRCDREFLDAAQTQTWNAG